MLIPSLTPERIAQIRVEADDEFRDHAWADRVIDELLCDAERRNAAAEAVTLPDAQGRTPADRIAAVRRHGSPINEQDRAAATALLTQLLAGAARYGATIEDFDWVTDLPGACLDVVLAQARKEGTR